jgi:hypothetical protein
MLTDWRYLQIDKYHLYAHPDLEVTVTEGTSALVLLIGYIFDPNHPSKTNEEIVVDIIARVSGFEDLITVLKPYAGRYAIIYQDETTFTIQHDPLGLREIYYCAQPNRVICGSQPNLLDALSEPKLGITKNHNILNFYKHDMELVRRGRLWVGEETYYHSVKHLMPNHYLDIGSLIAKRYWPNRVLEKMELSVAAKQSCDYLKGVLEAVTSRYDVMMAVTSGIDSRSLLAASRDIQGKIYYFINKEFPLNDKSADIRIPKTMFNRLNIPFHVHDVDGPVDEEFRKVFLSNVFMSADLILPTIYNVYFKNHANKVNLLGVGEIGREYYDEAPRDIDGYYLAHCLKYKRSMYATAQCEKWLRETKEIAEVYNVHIMRLLLWECLLGNWGVVGNSESDIAIEEFDPYDSHYIYEIMLSVDRTQGDLFEAIFKEMWPELLEFPFNPPETMSDWISHCLARMGLFKLLKSGKYRYDRWRYHRLAGALQE